MENTNSGKVKLQRFGSFLSNMVIPNIGAFIAWGLITALFIPTGWMPNSTFAKLVDPMLYYLLPLLIGYQGGKLVYGHRGGVVGAIVTIGVIVGADIPMFLGAMIMGPLGGYIIKKFDQAIDGKVPTGFEMLVSNFSGGIIGGLVALIAYLIVGPSIQTVSAFLSSIAQQLINMNLLPLVALIVEPAKVLFLNNAINYGVFAPLGIAQAAKVGKSVFFLLEPDPGPGLGILLAYCLYGKGAAKKSAPGAVIIEFLGGIHEIYFPYVLMKPLLVFAVMAGGFCGDLTFVMLKAGLVAVPSPGSIFAILAMTPKGEFIQVLSGVAIATVVSFSVACLILKRDKSVDEEDFEEAKAKVQNMKAVSKGKGASNSSTDSSTKKLVKSKIKLIIFACDAGMGSSAMGETILRKTLKNAGITDITVKHSSVDSIPSDADVVFTQENLYGRARKCVPNTEIITVKNFLDKDTYKQFIDDLNDSTDANEKETTQDMESLKSKIKLIIFACDAGMGSSAMGETILKKTLKNAGITDITVKHSSVDSIPSDADIVFTQENLYGRARKCATNIEIITVKNFLDKDTYKEFIDRLK